MDAIREHKCLVARVFVFLIMLFDALTTDCESVRGEMRHTWLKPPLAGNAVKPLYATASLSLLWTRHWCLRNMAVR